MTAAMRVCMCLLAAWLGTWLVSGAASAHPIYVALPEETLTDHLTESPVIVFARPEPANPFTFQPVAWLRGDPDADLPPIPHLVDSAAKRQLARNPEDAVLFVYRSNDTGWYRLVNVSGAVRQTVLGILDALPGWTEGRDDPARFAFFADRHNHPDTTVRKLALIELAQARYSLLRTLEPQVTRAEIEALLRNPTEYPLASLYIVMLGLIDDDTAAELIRRRVDTAGRLGVGSDLTAWATALIEIDERAAVERLSDMVLRPGAIPRKTAEAALTALAIHGTEGHSVLRDEIAETLGRSAAIDAKFAANAIATLGVWEDWRAAEAVRMHLTGGAPMGLQERLALTGYLVSAQKASQRAQGQLPPTE